MKGNSDFSCVKKNQKYVKPNLTQPKKKKK